MDQDDNGGPDSGQKVLFALLAIVILLVIVFIVWYYIRRKNTSPQNHKPLPGAFLRRKWQEWGLRGRYSKVSGRGHARGDSQPTGYAQNPQAAEEARSANALAEGVDRNTSIRSVMTLPAYSSNPKPTEQVIAREGERGGMDIVEEFPETADQVEAVREEEMESLYQIREARRREIREREERRAVRAEARMRGDHETLQRLRRESRTARGSLDNGTLGPTAAEMLAEHQSRGRDRRTSAVSYASLGLVRHDGTRIRSGSTDSERGGLLDSAAPMGENIRPWASHARTASAGSGLTAPRPTHLRNWSASSARSVSTTASDVERETVLTPQTLPSSGGEPSPGEGRTSQSSSDPRSSTSPTMARFTPPESDGDIGDNSITALATQTQTEADGEPEHIDSAGTQPPDYDNLDWGDAPPYSSPIRGPGENPPAHASTLERQLAERQFAQRQFQQQSQPQPNQQPSQTTSILSPLPESTTTSSSSTPTPATSTQQAASTSESSTQSRSQGVNRIPTNPPQLAPLRTLPSIRLQAATEPNTPDSPAQRGQSQRQRQSSDRNPRRE